MYYSFQALITHTHESFTRIGTGRKSRNVEAEAFDQGVQALVLRTLVAHDLLVDGTALELHDTAASLLLSIEIIMPEMA